MFRSTAHGTFDKFLEKATSNLLLEPDWATILLICDLIRQKDVQPKYAIAAVKKKLQHQNPHVAFFALLVLESLVKNCGSPIHEEVASKGFMEDLRDLCKTTQHENVKEKLLELIQTWAHAFRKVPSYRAVQDVLNIMKAEGSKFPPLVETDVMFKAEVAPEWADGECCNRCRTEFGVLNRKHHCRACGQIFCAKCSSKTVTLPSFGIEKEVRVCEACFEKYGREQSGTRDDDRDLLMRAGVPAHSLPYKQSSPGNPTSGAQQQPKGKTEEELAEEEQLQLALAISQSEAEAKEREKHNRQSGQYYRPTSDHSSDSASPKKSALKSSTGGGQSSAGFESEDPELAKYLDRDYWESRHGTKVDDKKIEAPMKASALSSTISSSGSSGYNHVMNFQPSAPVKENRDKNEQMEEIDTFMDALRAQIEMFVNRMKSNSSRGRSIYYDNSVQSLFMNITALHSQLLNYIQTQDNWRTYYEGLQDKLNQVRDARDALDALRKEHADRLRQIAEEAERQRQYQMAQKLQVMREQKNQYLRYQRELALQRVQEQERQMQLRIEQQRIGIPQPPGQYYGPPPPQGYMMSPPPEMGGPPNHYIPGQPPHSMPYMPPQQQQPNSQGQVMSPPGSGPPPQHHQMQQSYPNQMQYMPPASGPMPSSQAHVQPVSAMPAQGIPATSIAPHSQMQAQYYPPQQQQQPMHMATPQQQQNGANPEMTSNEPRPTTTEANTAELINFD